MGPAPAQPHPSVAPSSVLPALQASRGATCAQLGGRAGREAQPHLGRPSSPRAAAALILGPGPCGAPSRSQSAGARSMGAGWKRGAAAAPRVVPAPCASKVELRLSRQHLLDRDPLTKSDPSVVLLLQAQSQWVQVGAGLSAGQGWGFQVQRCVLRSCGAGLLWGEGVLGQVAPGPGWRALRGACLRDAEGTGEQRLGLGPGSPSGLWGNQECHSSARSSLTRQSLQTTGPQSGQYSSSPQGRGMQLAWRGCSGSPKPLPPAGLLACHLPPPVPADPILVRATPAWPG